MRSLKTILLATDLLPASEEAAKTAVRLATKSGARISVLHVAEALIPWEAAIQEMRNRAEPIVQQCVEWLGRQGAQVADSQIVLGPPADTIVQKAGELNADLIVIGAGKLSRYERFSAGPVAATVIEHAHAPVLAVRGGAPECAFQTILCAVDQSEPAARGLRNAARLARLFGGRLVVVTVVPAVTVEAAAALSQSVDEQEKFQALWQGEFSKLLEDSALEGLDVTKELRYGPPHQQIFSAAQEHQADLIVMGATGRSGLARVLVGSTTRRVLENLPCSLLTVKSEGGGAAMEEELRTIQRLMAEAKRLLQTDQYLAAANNYRQVLARNPYHGAAAEGLAVANEHLGETAEAEFYRRRADLLRAVGSA
jgi:nucleotide-binding universal stress UspA family protein